MLPGTIIMLIVVLVVVYGGSIALMMLSMKGEKEKHQDEQKGA